MSAEARLRDKLLVSLEPTRLDIVNESELHAGHRSSPEPARATSASLSCRRNLQVPRSSSAIVW